ncbi:MAG: ribose-phosphate diphosphokinase [Thermoprotei archaeon]|nr:MAG: ribose-phosphate diphosphokinase [Thermoprotei archaeon]
MKVLAGSGSRVLGLKVARLLNAEMVDVQVRRFPDGEIYVRLLGEVEGEDVVLVQSMGKNPNELLVEFLLLADTLKDLKARKVIAVVPYFPYARQDARFKPGEAFSLKTVVKLVEDVGIDAMITVDMHLHRIESPSKIFNIPAFNLTAMPLLAEYALKTLNLEEPIVVGPDEEAEQWAKTAAESIGSGYLVLSKVRLDDYKVEISSPQLNRVKGRNVLIVDDIISTGGTMSKAVKQVSEAGAKRIVAACTHPLLVGDSVYNILKAGAECVIGSDTVQSHVSYVSVAPIIANKLKEILFS